MALRSIFGDVLLTKTGERPTEEVLGGKKAIGIYFSAHWCPPCRGFTPELAKMYTSSFAQKGMEVIFVSSDKDEASFRQYYGQMPWCALPFARRDLKEALTKEYKLKSIPAFVIVGSDGELITKAGRSAVMKDPTGERFPWYPPTKEEKAKTVLTALGPEILAKTEGKYIGLYFSATWCPPCRGFTAKLAQRYCQGLKDKMEIVFVSSDRDQASFDDNYLQMPWLALPFEKRAEKHAITEACGVEGVPHLTVLNPDGTIMTTDGRSQVQSDSKIEAFPEGWSPQPFKDVSDDPSDLHEERCVVALGSSPGLAEAVNAVALEYLHAAGDDMSAMQLRFFKAPEGEMTELLRRLTGIESGDRLVILDIPNGGAFFVCEKEALDAASVKAFINDSLAGRSDRKRLCRG